MSDVLDKWSLLDVALRADRLNTALSTGMFDKWAIDDPALFQSRFEMLKGPSGLGPWSILDDELSQMLMNAALSGGPSPPPYVASAVHFDGTAEVGLTNQALGLAADSATGLFACWCNGSDFFNSSKANDGSFFIDTNNVNVYITGAGAANAMFYLFANAVGSPNWDYNNFGNSLVIPSTWFLYLASWDFSGSPGKSQLYYGDAAQTFNPSSVVDGSPFLVNYSDIGWEFLGSTSPGTGASVIGDAADYQLWCGNTFLDLTVTANRRLFIDGSGKPVKPSVAATALGQQTVLLSGNTTTFPNNQGTASATSVLAGTLTNASTSPSD